MSSTYDLICLSHEPALPLGMEMNRDQFGRIVEAREYAVDDHAECDIMVGRWSGGLVEMGCLGNSNHPSMYHTNVRWLEIALLRVLYQAARAPKDDQLASALGPVLSTCWSWRRLDRLRVLLGEPR